VTNKSPGLTTVSFITDVVYDQP